MNNRLLLLPLWFLLAAPAMAESPEAVERHYEYDITGVDELRIEFSVGTFRIEPSNGQKIVVDLTIKSEDSWSWLPFRRNTIDLTGMELSERRRGRELALHFDERNVSTEWVIRVPPLAALYIEAGVGTVEGELPAMPVRVDLGVGSVALSASRGSVGPVKLGVGVGDTTIRGAAGNDSRRAMVSSESSASGDGSHRVDIEVGVGDVSLDLRQWPAGS